MRTHEGWKKARDIKQFHAKHKGEKYNEYTKKLTFVELSQEAYYDYSLFVDDEGNYWEDSFYIGD